jgi:hypothetical protein
LHPALAADAGVVVNALNVAAPPAIAARTAKATTRFFMVVTPLPFVRAVDIAQLGEAMNQFTPRTASLEHMVRKPTSHSD